MSYLLIPVGLRGFQAKVDESDYQLVSQFTWCIKHKGNDRYYARHIFEITLPDGTKKRTKEWMHNLIMGFKPVDHINHDGLDNRRCNLRDGRPTLNLRNARKRSGTSSQYKGVFWNTQKGKWTVHIHGDDGKIYLGSFHDEWEAAQVYNEAALKLFGAYACINEKP